MYITGSEFIVVPPLHERHAQILGTTFLQFFGDIETPQCMYFRISYLTYRVMNCIFFYAH